MELKKFFELDELAKKEAEKYPKKRLLYKQLILGRGKHFIGIVGPRGVGKTILLKQIASEYKNSFYLSMDTLEGENLFKMAKTLLEYYNIKLLLLDEVHFQSNYEQELKKIFDFLGTKVIFTSSMSLSIFESSYDLSRRVKLFYLYPFSLREYLYFKKDIFLAPLTLKEIQKNQYNVDYLRYDYIFEDYIKGGVLPFSLEEPDILPLLENILRKIIYKDIPFVARLRVDELEFIYKVIKFIGKSPVEGINFTSIAKNIGITKYKAEQYVNLLEKAFVLNVVFPEGTNVLKEPKILMYLPYRLLYRDFKDCIGELREDFLVQALKSKGYKFNYLKTRRGQKTPDYLIKYRDGDIIAEVGGKGKGRSQFKGVKAKQKIIFVHPCSNKEEKRSLFLLGFL